jgi:hypothetical protein
VTSPTASGAEEVDASTGSDATGENIGADVAESTAGSRVEGWFGTIRVAGDKLLATNGV